MPTNSIAELASQLQAFISTKHPFASDLDPAILQSIEFYAPPPTSSQVPAPTSQERSSRSVARPPESPPYPVEWADSRSQLRSAVRHFQELLKRRTASELTGDAPEAFQSQANHPINSTITEDLTSLNSTAQAPETHQTVSQDTTTMASSSDSSTSQGAPQRGIDEHQEFRQEFRQEIMQMMLDLLEQRDRRRQLSETAAPPDPIGSARSTTSSDTATQATLKASEIGYFFPNMPLTWGDKDIIEKDGKLYYRNVYSFTNRIRVATQTRDTNKVKQMLDTCFRGEAELWWNNQLDDILRAGYLATEGVEKLCKALETRFRPPPSEALAKYNATRYSVEDCRSRRSITEYVATLEAAAKACGLGSASDDPQKRGLVIQTWMHLDLPLRETVDEPSEDQTLDEFTKVLLRKQNNWFDRYPPHGSRPRQAPYYQPPRYQSEQRHQLAPQFMPGPNWHPTSARQPSAPVSYPSRYSNQLGPPNSWNNRNHGNSTYPTYQFKSQSHWQSPNAPS